MNNQILTTNKYNSDSEYQRYSVSKIKTYKECSQMYKLKYVDGIYDYTRSDATLIGTILHSTLEYLYTNENITKETAIESFYKIIESELYNVGIQNPKPLLKELIDYNNDISSLYLRASKNYKGIDAIRTGKGDVPKSPEMTGVWKSEVKRMNLHTRKSRIDNLIKSTYSDLSNVSITDVFVKSFNIATNYKTPKEILKTHYLELPLSKWDGENNCIINPVPFPGCEFEDIYLNGFIDNISEINYKGEKVNAVIDYKTSKELFNENIVEHNQQLLIYAAGVSHLLNKEITHIGILSFIQKELIITPINKSIQEQVISNFNKVIEKTLNRDFIKHVPDSKYSPCLNMYGSECSYLKQCWVNSYNNINNVSDAYLDLLSSLI